MGSSYYGYNGIGFQIERAKNLPLIKKIAIDYFGSELEKDFANDIMEAKDATDIQSILNYSDCGYLAEAIADWCLENRKLNPDRISFEGFRSSEEIGEVVMFAAYYPWVYSEEERKLTRPAVEGLVKEFASILQIPSEDVGDLTCTYYG